jgi:Helix-turn-helix family
VTDAPRRTDPGDPAELIAAARRLRNVLEPIASNVYFSPDVNDAFEALGFGPGVGADGCLTIAEPSGYYCSRAACMGQVPGEVVVAAFGVFNPALIIPAVERGWSIATADEVLVARERGATASLARILGDQPALAEATAVLQRGAAAGRASGRFLYAGLRSLGVPPTPWGALWRAVDSIREHRGDSHLAAWIASGLDAVEIGLLTEIYYGMPSKRYHRGRGWTERDLDDGLARLRDRGLVSGEPPRLTAAGAELREAIEVATDVQQRGIIAAIGDDLDRLVEVLAPWSGAIVAAGGFPTSVEQIPPSWGNLPG